MGLIGTLQDLLHARKLLDVDGAPSPATGPDDRHGVVTPGPVDRIRPVVDRTDSQATRLPAVAGKYPSPILGDAQWDLVVRLLRTHGTKQAIAIAGRIDRQVQADRTRWAKQ